MSSGNSNNLLKVNASIEKFVIGLRRGLAIGSYEATKETTSILKEIVQVYPWKTEETLIEILKQYGKQLTQYKPLELVIINTVRRVLYIIREEYKNLQKKNEDLRREGINGMDISSAAGGYHSQQDAIAAQLSSTQIPSLCTKDSLLSRCLLPQKMHRSISRLPDVCASEPGILKVLQEKDDENQVLSQDDMEDLKEAIIGCIDEFVDEVNGSYQSIGQQAQEHIHANEVIMTFGRSRTVEEFLKTAARHRNFEVIVAEVAPSNAGRVMAKSLTSLKPKSKDSGSGTIEVTLITDAAIFALMSRVHKVIIGTHAVLANGGLIATSGMHMVAEAAKHYSVPVVVCTGMYKLSPLYSHDLDTFNELRQPSEVLSLEEAQSLGVSVKNPMWDYIPPELVSLYITNIGSHSPSYIYRLLAEYYHPEDMEF